MDITFRQALRNILGIGLRLVVFVVAFNIAVVKLTVLVAILGGLSIAIGLALKENVSNVANGIVLLVTRPFVVGDFIDLGAVSGTV